MSLTACIKHFTHARMTDFHLNVSARVVEQSAKEVPIMALFLEVKGSTAV